MIIHFKVYSHTRCARPTPKSVGSHRSAYIYVWSRTKEDRKPSSKILLEVDQKMTENAQLQSTRVARRFNRRIIATIIYFIINFKCNWNKFKSWRGQSNQNEWRLNRTPLITHWVVLSLRQGRIFYSIDTQPMTFGFGECMIKSGVTSLEQLIRKRNTKYLGFTFPRLNWLCAHKGLHLTSSLFCVEIKEEVKYRCNQSEKNILQ